MSRFILMLRVSFCFSVLALAQTAGATTVPFTEDFDADSANWKNFDNSTSLSFNATGGPDGSSYASGTYNFINLPSTATQGPVIMRAGATASGGNLLGDWIADGVTTFSAQVRHDASVPLNFFTRFASPTFFPGAIAVQFTPVLPNVWTEIEFDIVPLNPAFVSFEGSDFPSVFGSVGNIQIGVSVPAALAGVVDQNFTFSIDQVSVVPEPSSILMAGLTALACMGRRWK